MSFFHAVSISLRRFPTSYLLLLLFTASTLFPLPFIPRVGAQTTSDADEIINIRTDLVTVPVVVTDRRGNFVSGLASSDFALYDDDRAVPVAVMTAGVEKLTIAFVLDASGSVRDHLAQQERATLTFVDRFPQPPRAAVIHFNERPEIAVPFTTDAFAVRRGFSINARREQRTAIFDAALAAVRYFDSISTVELERRIIILISDGLDTASTISPSLVVSEANRRGIAIYVVHLPLYTPRDGRLAARPASSGFRELALRSGGRYYRIGTAKMVLDPQASYDFAPVFSDIVTALRGQYVLGYYPPASATQTSITANAATSVERRITVKMTTHDKRNLRVRTLRQSYVLRVHAGQR